jgi:DNA-binding protein H-NS
MDDLETMDLRELRDLQARVARAIATFEERRKKAALAEVEELLRQKGYSLSDITALAPARRRKAARSVSQASVSQARYANPANPAQTWSGRGRRPMWFSEAVAAGRDPETMRA